MGSRPQGPARGRTIVAASIIVRRSCARWEATMGLLVDRVWQDRWYDTGKSGGRFLRQESAFRSVVSADPGAEFPNRTGSLSPGTFRWLPWAHRTLIVRKLKGLGSADLDLGGRLVHGRARLDLQRPRGLYPRHGTWRAVPASDLHGRRGRTTPGGDCPRAVGSKAADHRQQRVVRIIRMLNRAFDAWGQCRARSVSRRAAIGDRCDQRAHLQPD